MNKLRAIFLSAVILFGGMAAGARTINTLIINRNDGKTDKIAMNENLDIRLDDKTGDILLVHPSITVSYPQALVKTLTAGFQNFASGNFYIGDHELKEEEDAIVTPEADGLDIRLESGAIRVSGIRGEEARLNDTAGRTVVSVKAEDGRALLSTASLPAGIYLLTVDKTTVKIKI